MFAQRCVVSTPVIFSWYVEAIANSRPNCVSTVGTPCQTQKKRLLICQCFDKMLTSFCPFPVVSTLMFASKFSFRSSSLDVQHDLVQFSKAMIVGNLWKSLAKLSFSFLRFRQNCYVERRKMRKYCRP